MASIDWIFADHAGGQIALDRAAQHCKATGQRALACGLDCLVAPVRLDLAAILGDARSGQTPYAPIPSEAAAMVLLGPGHEHEANLHLWTIAQEVEEVVPDAPNRGLIGAALNRVAHKVLSDCGPQAISAVIADMNGARFRAEEYGLLASRVPCDPLSDPICPALVLGDTGAASGVIALLMAEALVAQGQTGVLILGSSVLGHRVAMVAGRRRARGALLPLSPPTCMMVHRSCAGQHCRIGLHRRRTDRCLGRRMPVAFCDPQCGQCRQPSPPRPIGQGFGAVSGVASNASAIHCKT